jgi:tetratricopeptide (TPR) repeat protein
MLVFHLWGRSGARPFIEKRAWTEFVFYYVFFLALMLLTVLLCEYLVSRRFGLPERDFVAEWERMRSWLSRHARPGPRAGGFILNPAGTPIEEWAVILSYMVGGPAVVTLIYRRFGKIGERTHPNRRLSLELMVLFILTVGSLSTLRASDWSSEVRLWRHTAMEEPGSLLAWNNLGKAYMERRRFDLAATAYQRTVELDPDNAENHRNLGIALSRMGGLKGAKRAYERALKLSPGDVTSRNNLANILVFAADRGGYPGGYQEAIQHYLKILEYDPRNARALYNLAYCYYQLGALGQAESELMKSLYLNPGSEKSLWLRKRIMEERNRRR